MGVSISNYLKNDDKIILCDKKKKVYIFDKEIQIFDK